MKILNKISFGLIAILSLVIAAVCSLASCSDDLDVQQSYPFTVDVMPYGDKIVKGQTVELRFEIKPEGNYSNTLYTIRYSSMTVRVPSNSLTVPCWSTTTACFWRARHFA